MSNLELRNINKKFGDLKVGQNFNLSINDGDFVVLVGPSGCGKSTVLRMVAGLESLSSGEIEISDKNINDLPPHKRNIAMVFQNYALYPHKTVEENIVFGLKKSGATKEKIKETLVDVAKTLKLESYLNRKPSELSGGQRQRVAMGRAIARDADVYLFDEPLSNLDAKLRHHMRTEIARIHQRYQTTSLYVTHDQIEAMTLGDKVVVMKDGNIEQIGTPMEIYLRPINVFVATFIGSPTMNTVAATIKNNSIKIGSNSVIIEPPNHSSPNLIVGIRPDFFEDKEYSTGFQNAPKEYLLLENIRIELVESLGFDQEINFLIDKTPCKARLDIRTISKRGDVINLVVNLKRLLFFDYESGQRIEMVDNSD